MKKMTTPDRLFLAFADPVRLRILALLRREAMCVGDLVSAMGVPQATASRHLAHLVRHGLLESHRNSYWTYYRLAPSRTVLRRRLLACVDVAAKELPAVAKDAKRLRAIRRNGRCCD